MIDSEDCIHDKLLFMLNLPPPSYIYSPFCGKELDTKIEEGKERKWCTSCKWTYYPHVNCAVGAVIVKDDKVIMVKRNRDPYKGTWMFPAGFVDYGEHPEDTLKREVREETGLEVMKFEFISLLQNPDDPRATGHFGIFYKVTETEGEMKNDEDENQDLQWQSVNSLPEIGWESHKKVAATLGFH